MVSNDFHHYVSIPENGVIPFEVKILTKPLKPLRLVSIPENGVIPFEGYDCLTVVTLKSLVSIPENGVIPFEAIWKSIFCMSIRKVSIPENGVIPFEDKLRHLLLLRHLLRFNPREWGNTLRSEIAQIRKEASEVFQSPRMG